MDSKIQAAEIYANLKKALAELHAAELAEARHQTHPISAADARKKYDLVFKTTIVESTNPIIIADREA